MQVDAVVSQVAHETSHAMQDYVDVFLNYPAGQSSVEQTLEFLRYTPAMHARQLFGESAQEVHSGLHGMQEPLFVMT